MSYNEIDAELIIVGTINSGIKGELPERAVGKK